MSAPLEGIRVMEMTSVVLGPYACQMLGDLGADVIKIEAPVVGDPMRQWGREKPHGKSLWWPVVARNKKSITLNLREKEGQAIVRQLAEKADFLLDKVGISDKANAFPDNLSGGQQQRVAIARALINEPSIVMADEPTGNLDTKSGDEIMELLLNLNKDHGTTLIIVTHDPEIAEQTERVVYIRDGVVEEVK